MSSKPVVAQAAPQPDLAQPERNATELTLGSLKEQVSDVRAELAALRRELAGIRIELGRSSDVHLVKDNRRLMLVARKAEMRAAAAVASLIELSRASERDALTGTPNRTLMLERVERGISLARRRQMRVAILFADLDGFKQINDSFGHAVGDEALRVASRRFESVVRDSDTVSRHGGDEFLVLLTALSEASDAAAISAKLLASLARPARVGSHVLRLSASIGIAVYPEDGEDAATLIGVADAAMFRSKRRGPGRFGFHEPRLAVTGS